MHEDVYVKFVMEITNEFSSAKIGDLLTKLTFLAPLSPRKQTITVSNLIKNLSNIRKVKGFGKASGGIIPLTMTQIREKFDE